MKLYTGMVGVMFLSLAFAGESFAAEDYDANEGQSKDTAALQLCANVVVVDVNKIVAASPEVEVLKAEEAAEVKKLRDFIREANEIVAAVSDESAKKEVAAKYRDKIELRKNLIEQDYAAKLKIIDANITSIIAKVAKDKGATMVLAKANVIWGGEDISDDVIAYMKKQDDE